MFTNANDSTVCLLLPTPESDPVSEIYVSDEEYDDGFDDKFEAVLAKLVEFERSADPARVEPVRAEPVTVVEESELAVAAAEPTRVVPRVWTVFLTLLLTIGAIVVAQIGLVMLLAIGMTAAGVPSQELGARLMKIVSHPAGFIGLGLVSQLLIGLAAVLPAKLSRTPMRQRLGLVAARLPNWGYPVVMIASLLPASLGFLAAASLAEVIPPDNSVATLFEGMTPGWAIPFVLFISLAPGLMEELLFRGYLQTRLLQRWKPGFAIVVSSSLFALFHITPHSMALAFIAGLYLGVLAWRTGSIWPGVLCHAFINGSVNVLRLGEMFGAWSGSTSSVIAITLIGLSVVCFGVSVWLMIKAPSAENLRCSRTREHSTRLSVGLAQA